MESESTVSPETKRKKIVVAMLPDKTVSKPLQNGTTWKEAVNKWLSPNT